MTAPARPPILSETLAWLAQCDALPPEVDAKARLLLLDTVGCLLAGLRHGEVGRLGAALTTFFPGTLAWSGAPHALGPAGLAALGAAAACWDEACEGHAAAHGRPALPVVPALLALAAQRETSLGALLLALVTGYEIGARAGQAWRIPAGLHVDGSWHSLGAAAAAARLTAGPAAMASAVEAAACQIPASLYLPIAQGSVLRNTYPAHAALLGMLAAAAAQAGFAMPAGALDEGRVRVLRASTPAEIAPPGTWTILDGYLKPFAGVRHTHYGVEAALRLRAVPGFAANDIRAIRLAVYEEAVRYCGNRAPRTAIQAQFSLSYATAAALALGHLDPAAYGDALADPEIKRLEAMVAVEVDPARSGRGAVLTVDLGGKELRQEVASVIGDPNQPMTADRARAKFLRYAAPSLGAERAAAVAAALLDRDPRRPLETLSFLIDVRKLA